MNKLAMATVDDLVGAGSYRVIDSAAQDLSTIAATLRRFVLSDAGRSITQLDRALESLSDEVANVVMESLSPTLEIIEDLGDLVATLAIAAAQAAERLW